MTKITLDENDQWSLSATEIEVRIMNAAPEMLRALHCLTDALHINAPKNSVTMREAVASAVNAIAKAEGETK